MESLLDVPLEDGVPDDGHIADRLLAIPFRQVRERGFAAHDDGTPLVVVDVETELEFSVAEVVDAIDDTGVEFSDRGGFETDDEEYGKLVAAVIADEIGQGEGANLVIGRHYRATIADWGPATALTVFRRLLERERGAYWTFLFFTGDRYLIGASPERHVTVHGGDVRMNPISGTFRIPREGEVKPRLMEFLADEKEIYELFMVVDEELKMMCDICSEGGQVLGPFLKPMTHLVHTEYLLAGRTDRDPREVLRDTMYAATVTGSPVENACRLIAEYEPVGRGYYGAALAILGRDAEGGAVVDSPIVIRTADVDLDGRLTVTAGATLVRDSDAAYEVAETHAKAGGILSAFGLVPPAPRLEMDLTEIANDEDVLLTLNKRNRRLSQFWLDDQGDADARPAARRPQRRRARRRGRLREHAAARARRPRPHLHRGAARGLRAGLPRRLRPRDRRARPRRPARRRRPQDGHPAARRRLAAGARSGRSSPSASAIRRCVTSSGIPLNYKDIVFQGTQSAVTVDGRAERVGFYNTFVGRVGAAQPGAAGRGARRRRPRHRRRAPPGRPALPRHPVPRRVDPHRARLRPAARPRVGAAAATALRRPVRRPGDDGPVACWVSARSAPDRPRRGLVRCDQAGADGRSHHAVGCRAAACRAARPPGRRAACR